MANCIECAKLDLISNGHFRGALTHSGVRKLRCELAQQCSIYLWLATPLCNYHLLFRAAYCGHAWLCRWKADGLGCYNTSGSPSPLSLLLPYCLITPRSSSLSCLGGIFSVHSVEIGSAQPRSWSPGAEIVRILAPIFSEQIALVRSTTLCYGAALTVHSISPRPFLLV